MDTQNKHDFKIKFDKNEHSINIDTYVQSLSALSILLKEVNYQVDCTNPNIAVNVVAEESGSFDVLLQVAEIVQNNGTIIRETVEALSWVVTIAVGVIQLRKWIKKSDESKTEINNDSVTLKDSNNNIIHNTNLTVYNLFKSNQTVNDAVTSQFQAINKDDEIDAITITNNGTTTKIERDDFESLSEKQVIDTSDREIVNVSSTLIISKLVLDNRERKWELVYQGNKINAKITDDAFWERVLSGKESFANGDKLVCNLEISREYDVNLGTFLDKDYRIFDIRQHLPRETRDQITLSGI